jgi:hypothetical protein
LEGLANGGGVVLSKKQTKIIICILQAAIFGLMFLPSARAANSAPLNAFDLMQLYSAAGFNLDSLVYAVLAICGAAVTVLALFLLRSRRNFGTAACLSAFLTVVHACFFTALKKGLAGTVTLTGMHYLIVLLALMSMATAIHGFLISAPTVDGQEARKP